MPEGRRPLGYFCRRASASSIIDRLIQTDTHACKQLKVGFVSDAHGNPLGLQGCISELHTRGAELIYFLGDAVGYFPLAIEVIEILRRHDIPCLLGNHDAMLCGLLPLDAGKDRVYGLSELAQRMDPVTREQVSKWPTRRRLEIGGRRLLLVHGSPRDELSEYIYPDTEASWFGSIDADAVFMGHTHIPFAKKFGHVLAVNVGSCGLPRDIGNQAACALFDTHGNSVEIIRIPFDTVQLLAMARARGKVADQVVRCLERRRLQSYAGEPHE
ncbi:MAG: metallophosphoesterase family protein [Burkholderiales bacterium]